MLKTIKYSIPVLVAGLVLTGRTQELESPARDAQPGVGGPATSQQEGAASRDQNRLTPQQRNQQSTFQPDRVSDSHLKRTVTELNKASSFIGMAVKNLQNEDMGKINDLVFDPQNGKISYAVVSIGGLLGVGDKLIAVPLTSLRAQPGQKHLVINMDKGQVQAAPGLAQGNWPDLDAYSIGAPAAGESGISARPGQLPGTDRTPSTTPGTVKPDPSTSIPKRDQ